MFENHWFWIEILDTIYVKISCIKYNYLKLKLFIWLIHLWKHFENSLGEPPKVVDETITKIICYQLDIKLGQFTQELKSVLRKIKNRKAARIDEIPPEILKTREFDNLLLQYWNAVYNENTIDRWTKGCILFVPKKDDLGLVKNYRGIILTSIEAKIYNALL